MQFTHAYAFSPFRLVSRCLQKVAHDVATVKMIVPVWTTQVSFSSLLNLLIDNPHEVCVTNAMLSNPLLPSTTLYLLVCKLSVITFLTKAFFRKYCHVFLEARYTTTVYKLYLQKWSDICFPGQFNPLCFTGKDAFCVFHTEY